MSGDWAAVAAAINTRMEELRLPQKVLAERSKVSVATIRQLQKNYVVKDRNPRTLEALSVALQWPPDYLQRVLTGAASGQGAPALAERVEQLGRELEELRSRVAALEGRAE